VTATGRALHAAHSVPRMMDHVREASTSPNTSGARWWLASYDLQKVEYMAKHAYNLGHVPAQVGAMQPDPELVAEAVERLAAASADHLGGRGVLWSAPRDAVNQARRSLRALLSNTLAARSSMTIRSDSAPPAATSRRWAGRCTSPRTSCSRSAPAFY